MLRIFTWVPGQRSESMKLSLITACRNSAATLSDTLASVRAQRAVDLEYILVDGASTDGTVGLIETAGDLVSCWVSETDAGIYDALNKGIDMASGEIVGFLHADDIFADERVLARIAASFEDPAVDACYGDLVYVRRDDPERVVRSWRPGEYRRKRLRWGWMPPHPTLYVRRALYERHGGFNNHYRIAADYDCMLRLLSRLDGRVVYLPEVLVRMRLGGASNHSIGNILRKSVEDYRVLRENRVGGVGTLLWKNLSKLSQFVSK